MALIYILDKQHDEIIGTLNTEKGQVNEPLLTTSIENINTFNMRAYTHFDKLTKRNRLLVQDVDGFFEEFIITYANQYKREEKEVRSMGSFIDLQTAKVIEPQNVGDTPIVCVNFALSGTEWQAGKVEYTGNLRNINVEEHTDPYSLLKLIASTFDLEIRYRVEVEGNRIIGRYVDMVQEIAGFEGKEIEFGKDLIGIRLVEDSMNIVTALVGLGPIREDGTRLEVYVENQEALERWGRNGRHLVRVYEPESIDEDMTLERLTTLTKNELEKRIDAITTYECESVSLEKVFGRSHEAIRLGQTNRIKDDGYSPPLYLEARIREMTENVANREVVDFKIGNYIEFSKDDLERQVKALRQLLAKKIDDARLQDAIEQVELELEDFIDENVEKKIPVQPTPPDPSIFTKWIDDSVTPNVLKIWNGTWVKASPTEAAEIGAETPEGAQEKVDAIEVGGRNLLRNSDFEKRTAPREHMYFVDAHDVLKNFVGKELTFSFDIKADVPGNVQFYSTNNARYRIPTTQIRDVTTEYQRRSVTLQISDAGNSRTVSFLEFYGIYDSGRFVDVRNMKIEIGNKATDWTPAPEDVSEEAQSKADTAKQDAINAAQLDAKEKADAAQQAAETYAKTKAEAERVLAEAHADGIVSAEEQARIAQANANLEAAQKDATDKANAAEQAAKVAAALDATQKAESAESNAKSYADSQDASVYQDATVFAEQVAANKADEAQNAAEETSKNYTDENAVIKDKQYTNGLLWSDLLGLIVARSDGKMRAVMSGDNGFYIEQKVDEEWVKLFYADATGLKYAGNLDGASGTFSGDLIGGKFISVDGRLILEMTTNGVVIYPPEELPDPNERNFTEFGSNGFERFYRVWNGVNDYYEEFIKVSPEGIEGRKGEHFSGTVKNFSIKPELPFQNATMLNGWVSFSDTYYSAQFMKDPMGFVHLRGSVRGGLQGTAFVLPAGYRPSKSQFFPSYSRSTDTIPARCRVTANGEVQLYSQTNENFSLDGITFLAEQ